MSEIDDERLGVHREDTHGNQSRQVPRNELPNMACTLCSKFECFGRECYELG